MDKLELKNKIVAKVISYMYDYDLDAKYKTISIDSIVKLIDNNIYDIDSKYLGRFYYSFHEFNPKKMKLDIYYTFTENIEDLKEEMDTDIIENDTILLFNKRNRDINNSFKKLLKYTNTYVDIDSKYSSDLVVSTFIINSAFCVYDRRKKEIVAFSTEKEKNRNEYLFDEN